MTISYQNTLTFLNEKSADLPTLEIVFAEYLHTRCWLTSDPLKKPFNPRTKTSEWGAPDLLCQFHEMRQFLESNPGYLPCIVPARCGLIALDLDKIALPGEQHPDWSVALAQRFGTYCEVSQSGCGLHIILKGESPGPRTVGQLLGCKIEFLANHCVTLTANILQNFDTLQDNREALQKFYQEIFSLPEKQKPASAKKSPLLSNHEVVSLLSAASNRTKFEKLYYAGNVDDYGGDHSSADFALVALIAFYTQNPTQVFEIIKDSALYKLPERQAKWARDDYKITTIEKAIAWCKEYYQPKKQIVEIQTGTWENPAPIDEGEDTEHAFPLEALPECLRIAAEEVGRFSCTDPALAAVPGLGMAALQTGKKILVQEKPGLIHHPSLIFVGAVDTGERKTSNENGMLDDIKDAIENEGPAFQQQTAIIKAHNDLVADQINTIKKSLREARINAGEAQKALEGLYADNKQLPPEPINFSDDITPQRLFQKLHLHGGAYGIFSSDGRKFLNRILGRAEQSGVTGEDIYVAASWGDSIHRSRVTGRDGEGEDLFIRKPALTIAVLVQRDLWREFLRNKTMRESGFIARFCPVSPLSRMGTRFESEDELPLDKSKISPYTEAILKCRRWKTDKPVILSMSPEAAKARRKFFNAIEEELGPGSSLEDVKDIATRAISIAARLAGIFAVLDAASEQGDEIRLKPITVEQWLRAQDLEEYFLSQLIDMQRTESGSGKGYLLQKTARWLQKELSEHTGSEPLFILGSLLTNRVRGLDDQLVETVILPTLEQKGWIRKAGMARRNKQRYEVNRNVRKLSHEG